MFLSCAGMTGLWGLVNNAGILYLLPIEWTSMDIFKRTADVNLWGMIDVTKTFLPLVKKAQGRVVNFSSAAGKGYTSITGFPRDNHSKYTQSNIINLVPRASSLGKSPGNEVETFPKLPYWVGGTKKFRHFP